MSHHALKEQNYSFSKYCIAKILRKRTILWGRLKLKYSASYVFGALPLPFGYLPFHFVPFRSFSFQPSMTIPTVLKVTRQKRTKNAFYFISLFEIVQISERTISNSNELSRDQSLSWIWGSINKTSIFKLDDFHTLLRISASYRFIFRDNTVKTWYHPI